MATNRVILPYQYYPDPTRGRPVFFGSIYIGEVDKDPEVYPVQAFVAQENGPIVPIDQPINTGAGGVILVDGSPAIIVVDGDYSMRVRDQQGAEVYYVPNSIWSGTGGGGGEGDFVKRIGDSMVGALLMYNEAKTIWYADQGTTPRAEVFTSNVTLEGERSGIRLFDQYGSNGNQPGLSEELVSIRTENGTDGILRSAAIVQRNKGTPSSAQDWSGIIGLNNVRDDTDDAVFFIQGENAPFLSWFGTAWDQAEGLNSTQLRICRPAAGTTIDYISLCNVADGTPFFTVDPNGNVNIKAGATYQIDGVPTGGGVGEAPVDGSTYGRNNAAWVDISGVIAGDFLPYDGSLPFTGTVGNLVIQRGTKFIWTDDVAGLVKRAEMIAEPVGTDPTRRTGLRLFDIDGNAGSGVGDANQELVSLRAQVNSSTGQNEGALVVQNNVGTSTSANGFNGIIGFNNIEKAVNYAQFIIQGTAAEYPDGRDRRRAWFGTAWAAGPNPDNDGLESIQLYINRPNSTSAAGMIDFRVADSQVFTVTDQGRVDAAGVIRAQGLSGGFGTGFGVEIYSDIATKEGIIRCYDADLGAYGKLFVAGDEVDFRTTNNANAVVSNLKIWQNPATPTIDEIAIFNKAQLRQYTDASGTAVAFELFGTAIVDSGLRLYQPGLPNFGVQLQSANGGVSSLWLRKPGGTGTDYGISLDSGATGASVIQVDGNIIALGSQSQFNGLTMTTNGIDMNNRFISNLPTPTADFQAATKKYVDDSVGAGGGPYMDLATNQTANGNKTFNDTIFADGIQLVNNGLNCNGNQLYNPATPTVSSHVGDRGYNDGRYLAIGAKAADADLLDGINSTSFVRTSLNQTISGTKTWTGESYHSTNIRLTNGSVVLSNGSVQLPFDASSSSTAQRRDWILSQVSDDRLKDNKMFISDVLDSLDCLQPFTFDFKNESDNKRPWKARHYGLSAQEVQRVFPEAVHHLASDRDDDGNSKSGSYFLGLDYAELVPVLVAAIQDLKARLDANGIH